MMEVLERMDKKVTLVEETILENLSQKAVEIRQWVIKMLTKSGSGHPGGSLSSTDIITALYFSIMQHRPSEPNWPERDRFVLSKGHCCPPLYAALAINGYFPLSTLMTLRKIDSILEGHPDKSRTTGIECSTGSLGQGLSIACGMALAAKMDKEDWWTYCLLGDGETQEGQIWEAAMAAAHYKLDNLCAFLDFNLLQIDGPVKEVMNIEPALKKWRAFGWNTVEIDGHDMKQIVDAVKGAKKKKGKPHMIIAHTIKGKGVSFMEGQVKYHGITPTQQEYEMAMEDLKLESYR